MKANKIEQNKQYEVTVGKNTTIVRVVEIERRVNGTLVFQCENVKTGKPMTIADADRFRKEIKTEKKTLKEAIEAKGITVIPKGRRATSTMRDLDDPTFSRKHHVDENGVLVLEADDTVTETAADKPKRERAPRPDGTVSGLEAALIVLREAGEPMNIKQIMEKINERGLAKLNGKTPDATVSAAMQREIGRGESSRFEKAGKGLFRAK